MDSHLLAMPLKKITLTAFALLACGLTLAQTASVPVPAPVASTRTAPAGQTAPRVLVSIKPIHSLVAAIMQGVGTPQVLLDGNASPHTFQLRPSHARQIHQANVLFWVGPDLEKFLEKPLQALGDKAQVVTLADAPGLQLLDYRSGGAFESHDHAAAHDGHDHADGHDHGEGKDLHFWLNPLNAQALAGEIAARLTQADPAHAEHYQRNLQTLQQRLAALDSELSSLLQPVKDKPFVVFHDAYQYLEARYHLNVSGSITVSPEVVPGAARIAQMRQKIQSLGAACVFSEPQFEPRIIQTLVQGTPVRTGVLNPEGGELPAGENLYFDLMRGNAKALRDCLGQGL